MKKKNSSCRLTVDPPPSFRDGGYALFEEENRIVEVRAYDITLSGKYGEYPEPLPEDLAKLRAEISDGEWTVVDESGARWRRDADHPFRPTSAAHALGLAFYRPDSGQWTT